MPAAARGLGIAALAAGVLSLLSCASPPALVANAGRPPPVPEKDLIFAEQAALSSLLVLEAGKLARERAEAPEVRAYASTVAKEQGMIRERLARVAQLKDVLVPKRLDEDRQKKLEALRSSGDFDDDYTDAMSDALGDTVDLFEEEAEAGEDQALRRFALASLASLRDHELAADRLDRRF